MALPPDPKVPEEEFKESTEQKKTRKRSPTANSIDNEFYQKQESKEINNPYLTVESTNVKKKKRSILKKRNPESKKTRIDENGHEIIEKKEKNSTTSQDFILPPEQAQMKLSKLTRFVSNVEVVVYAEEIDDMQLYPEEDLTNMEMEFDPFVDMPCDEEEISDEEAEPDVVRPCLVDYKKKMLVKEKELLEFDLFKNIKQYVDYKLVFDFAYSSDCHCKLKNDAEVYRSLVCPSIKQFKRDFIRNCILVRINDVTNMTFGSKYSAQKRFGPSTMPGTVNVFFELLEGLVFGEAIKDLEEEQKMMFDIILRIVNQSSCALPLKMFTAWWCVKDGQSPPVLTYPTRLIRANQQMKKGSSQIDLLFNLPDGKKQLFIRREYVEVLDFHDLEAESCFWVLEQKIWCENKQWKIDVKARETLKTLDPDLYGKSSLLFQ